MRTRKRRSAKAEGAYRKAVEIDPSEVSHQRGLGQTLLSDEKYPEALKVYQTAGGSDAGRFRRLFADCADLRELHQLDKAEETLTKARQFRAGQPGRDVQRSDALSGAGKK